MGIKATAGLRTGGIKVGGISRNTEILPMPHITIGDVETLPAGSSATATMTGTIDYPVLNLGIPQGDTGETGATGTAATIAVGTVTGGATASVTNSGTSSAAVFDFVLPKGDTGSTGSAATISVGTVTSGSTASVINSGTSSAAVFDFVLPKGDKGDTGTGIPSGGSDGQLVGKSSGSIAWVDPPVTDDHKWNDVALTKSVAGFTNNDPVYLPAQSTSTGKTAYFIGGSFTPTARYMARYDANSYLHSTTPSASDNSTKCATTAYVDAAIPTVPTNVSSFNNDAGYLTLSTLPIYDGSVT